jgi:hypothetical protein
LIVVKFAEHLGQQCAPGRPSRVDDLLGGLGEP